MRRWAAHAAWRIVAALVLAAPAFGADFPHDVYIWQRHWTPAVRDALAESRDIFAGVRVLVAQAGRDGRWAASDVTPADFLDDMRPLIAVVRYDGAGAAPDAGKLEGYLAALFERWRGAGRAFAGVEIDYDCATSKLPDYAQRLRALRRSLPPDVVLSVTALPTWTAGGAVDPVIAAVDETVLQLHAIDDPSRGLFDEASAERATRAFAARTTKPFRVSLPAYGYRVRFDEEHRPYAVESEMPVDAAEAADAHELAVEPRDVAQFLRMIDADPPPNWRGVVWFRLPVVGDRRAWTLAAIRDVATGRSPEAHLAPLAVARENGATDLFVANDSDVDATARVLRVHGDRCASLDAVSGWRSERDVLGWRFVPDAQTRIRARTRAAVGWIRCASAVDTELE